MELKIYAVNPDELDKSIDATQVDNEEFIQISKRQKLVFEVSSFESAFNAGLVSPDKVIIRIILTDDVVTNRYQVIFYDQEEGDRKILEVLYFETEPDAERIENLDMPTFNSKFAEVYYDRLDNQEFDDLVYDIVLNA